MAEPLSNGRFVCTVVAIGLAVSLPSCADTDPDDVIDAGTDAGPRECEDVDHDGYGEGLACLGPDCDEGDADRQEGCAADCGSVPMDVGCPCDIPEDQPTPCFGGDDALIGIGRCIGGLAVCLHGTWSACFGQRLPRDEETRGHDSIDDDCNGFIDDKLCGDVDDCGGQCCSVGEVCLGTACGHPLPCDSDADCDDDTHCLAEGCVPYTVGETNRACDPFGTRVDPLESFDPQLQCEWVGDDELSQVMTPGLVVDLDPVVGDDIHPEIIFSAFGSQERLTSARLVAIDGETCTERWRSSAEEGHLTLEAPSAVGDIDGDGTVEIVAGTDTGGVAMFDADGHQVWRVDGNETALWSPILIANLDGKGDAEILRSTTVYDSAGSIVWSAEEQAPSSFGQVAVVADVDLDGRQEVVTGSRILDGVDGTAKQSFDLVDGFPAVADFDKSTPEPEIAVIAPNGARIQTVTGEVIFGPVNALLAVNFFGGPPVIADFDDDGEVEFGSAGGTRYVVFDPDCTADWHRDGSCVGGRDDGVLWEKITQDFSSGVTGSSVFDFDFDGVAEVVYNDECFTRVYDGLTGDTRWIEPSTTATGFEYPIIADADGDGQTEIVVPSNDLPHLCSNDIETGEVFTGPRRGLQIWRDVEDRWADSRRVWNQHSYSVTNVTETGGIPLVPDNNWQAVGLNNFRVNTTDDPSSPTRGVDVTARAQPPDIENCPDSITLNALIANRGIRRAPRGVPVGFYAVDPDTHEETRVCWTRTTGDLRPGASELVSCLWPNPPQEPTSVHVIADDSGALIECDENNNDATIDRAYCRLFD